MVSIRAASADDIPAIRELSESAFGQPAEADLVDALHRNKKVTLTLVAVEGQELVGYVLFSPVTMETSQGRKPALALAPLAVTPTLQHRGIGSQLVHAGLDECRRLGHERVVVVGRAEYYRRFGFVRANRFGLKCEYDVPEETFMALELRPGALGACAGVVKFAREFSMVT